jgi:hypothetical protein
MDSQIVLPSSQALNIKGNPNWKPALRRGTCKNPDLEHALDALEWGVLPFRDFVGVGDRCLPNDFQLEEVLEPG